jgi:DNA-binding LacI/PurR family transcriptional regulator
LIWPGLSHARWLAGYAAAHALAGAPLDNGLVQVTNHPESDMAEAAEAYANMPDPPTAFVIPDVRIAWTFVQSMQQRGRPVRRDSLVCLTNPSMAEHFRMQGFPMIYTDNVKMVETAMWHLRALADRKMPVAGELLLPFEHRDFPEPPAATKTTSTTRN